MPPPAALKPVPYEEGEGAETPQPEFELSEASQLEVCSVPSWEVPATVQLGEVCRERRFVGLELTP